MLRMAPQDEVGVCGEFAGKCIILSPHPEERPQGASRRMGAVCAVTAREIVAVLATLQRQAERLTVCHRNPEKFHEDKSELVAALARLRRQLEGQ